MAALASVSMVQGRSDLRLCRYPAISGNTVVFTYAGDLWSWDRGSAVPARRLTTHGGEEFRAKISPDGKWVAFTGAYDGGQDLYVVSIDGGEPVRLTFEPGPEFALCWTPSGKIAYASSYGGINGTQPRLRLIDPKGGMPQTTPILEVNQGTFTPDGDTFIYNRMPGQQQWWRNYRGGMQPFISLYNLRTNTYSELPKKREMSAYPMAIGNSVYFLSDKNQRTMNIYRYDLASKRETQVTNFTGADVRWPSADGKSIIFERDGYLNVLDVATSKIEPVRPLIVSDNWNSRPQMRNVSQAVESFALSPTGARLAVIARGELFSVPAKTGETRNMSESSGSRERLAAWSPNGASIAYFSDKSGENQLYVVPQMGGAPMQITSEKGLFPVTLSWSPDGKQIAFSTRSFSLHVVDLESKKLTQVLKNSFSENISYDWSPDSKWLAITEAGPNQFSRVALYELATGKRTTVNDGAFVDTDVAFDLSGKYLYYVSNRTFNPGYGLFEYSLKVEDSARVYVLPLTKDLPNPLSPPVDEEPVPGAKPAEAAPSTGFKIDFEGLSSRAIPLPLPPGNYGLVSGLNEGLLLVGPGGLMRFDLRSREPQVLMANPAPMTLNQSRTKIAFMVGGQVFIQDLRPGIQPGPGRVDMSAVEMLHDPRAEWKQMFWEAWRYERDFFYNPNMNGLDWNAIGKRYEGYLDSVNHRLDLSYVLGLLIGELETGHAYVQGFGSPVPNPVNTGLLGVDYEVSGNHVRLKKIYRGANYDESFRAPLGEPGIDAREGDYLLAIDGKPVTASVNPNSLLIGKAGRTVLVTLNSSPSEIGARTIRVRPVATENAIRYNEWVETCRATVDRLSGGKIGYMHIPNTSTDGAIALIKGFYSQVDKAAVVVDERYNGGGFIQPWFVDTLGRKMRAKVRDRNGNDWQDAVAIEGPKAMLINGYAGSGGDFFPWMFKQSKLGPLIGGRTWGGLVGIRGGISLLDGGSVTVPEFGIYDHTTGQWIAENKGVDPDIEVDARPDLVAQGRDPQLERAVEYLLEEIKKGGPNYKPPTFPTIPPK